jgi:hypothetical protein
LREIVVELQAIAVDIQQAAIKLQALKRALAQIDVASAVAPGDIVVGLVAHPLAQRMLVNRQIIVTHKVQPLDDILAAVAP